MKSYSVFLFNLMFYPTENPPCLPSSAVYVAETHRYGAQHPPSHRADTLQEPQRTPLLDTQHAHTTPIRRIQE